MLRQVEKLRRLPVIAVALALGGNAYADQELLEPHQVDPELQQLESAYAAELLAARKALGANYLLALRRLQDDLTQRGQIEQALAVKIERERVTQLVEQPPELNHPTSGSRPPKRVKLDVPLARCSGGVLHDERRAALRNWTAAGGQVLWDLDADMPAGRYEVIVSYNAGRDAGGTFELATAGGAKVRGSVETRADSDWKDDVEMLAGTLSIDPDSRTLAITAVALRQPYLWSLRGVRLEPAGTWAELQAAAAKKRGRGKVDNPSAPPAKPLVPKPNRP